VVVELTDSKERLVLDVTVIEGKPEGQKVCKATLQGTSSLGYVPRFGNGEVIEVPSVLYKYTIQNGPLVDLSLFAFPVGLSKFSLEELSCWVSRENVCKVYTFGDLVTGNLGSRVRNNLFLSRCHAWL